MLNAAPAHVDGEQRVERGTERNSVHAAITSWEMCAGAPNAVWTSQKWERKNGSALGRAKVLGPDRVQVRHCGRGVI